MTISNTIDRVYNGLYAVRSELIDYCSEEKVSSIIGYLFEKTKEVEKANNIKSAITKFALKSVPTDQSYPQIIVEFIHEEKPIFSTSLKFVNNELTHLSEEEEMEKECIPFSSPGHVITNIKPVRMSKLITNSYNLLSDETKQIATAMLFSIEKQQLGESVRYELRVQTRNIRITANIDGVEVFKLHFPICWFDKKKKNHH